MKTRSPIALPAPVTRSGAKVARKRVSNSLDMQNLLHFSKELYAHALTLQEVLRNRGGVTYEALRPKYDRQAAQQFEVFYHTFRRPLGLRKRAAGTCE